MCEAKLKQIFRFSQELGNLEWRSVLQKKRIKTTNTIFNTRAR